MRNNNEIRSAMPLPDPKCFAKRKNNNIDLRLMSPEDIERYEKENKVRGYKKFISDKRYRILNNPLKIKKIENDLRNGYLSINYKLVSFAYAPHYPSKDINLNKRGDYYNEMLRLLKDKFESEGDVVLCKVDINSLNKEISNFYALYQPWVDIIYDNTTFSLEVCCNIASFLGDNGYAINVLCAIKEKIEIQIKAKEKEEVGEGEKQESVVERKSDYISIDRIFGSVKKSKKKQDNSEGKRKLEGKAEARDEYEERGFVESLKRQRVSSSSNDVYDGFTII